MKKIVILDTSIATKNIGDEIIVDSITKELENIFERDIMLMRVPTHEIISRWSRRIIKESDYTFVAGTNILNSRYKIIKSNQWNLRLIDILFVKNIILMGTGWANYQSRANILVKFIYKRILNKEIQHSVRDSYTERKMKVMGLGNVINTACPTMWQLTPQHCKTIPKDKATNVVTTLTDYRINYEKDLELFNILIDNYEKVYLWIQGSNDLIYYNKLKTKFDCSKVILIDARLKSYDNLLKSDSSLDYVGTRLHAGIRAMQYKRRTIIIGVDNRAIEKRKDFNINVLTRDELSKLGKVINSELATELTIDFDAINKWKNQFKNK